jgi:hypothetical protein
MAPSSSGVWWTTMGRGWRSGIAEMRSRPVLGLMTAHRGAIRRSACQDIIAGYCRLDKALLQDLLIVLFILERKRRATTFANTEA